MRVSGSFPRVTCLVLCLTVATAPVLTPQDRDLVRGIALVNEGDFKSAVITLEAALRALAGKEGAEKEHARAQLYLGLAYLELDQESIARSKFREALRLDADLRLDAEQFSPQVIRTFEATRLESTAAETARATPDSFDVPAGPGGPSSTAPVGVVAGVQPQERRKKKVFPLLLVGGGGAALAGVILARGGGTSASPVGSSTTTLTPAAPTTDTTTSTTTLAPAPAPGPSQGPPAPAPNPGPPAPTPAPGPPAPGPTPGPPAPGPTPGPPSPTPTPAPPAPTPTPAPPAPTPTPVPPPPPTTCNYNLTPGSLNVGAAASNGTCRVATGAGCGWTAGVDQGEDFVTLTGGTSGPGNGTITYRVAANPTNRARKGRIRLSNTSGADGNARCEIDQAAGPAFAPTAALVWTSALEVAGGAGQVIVDGAKGSFQERMAQSVLAVAPGAHRVEALLVTGDGRPGTWRFDLGGTFEAGTLRPIAGDVVSLTGDAIVFRLRGRPGERVGFAFQTAR